MTARGPSWLAALMFASSPVEARDGEDEARRLDAVVVTGTRLPAVALEGPLPVTTVQRAEWQHAGLTGVADLLRRLPWNSFGSAGELPNSAEAGASQPQLRGLGSKYTLVLLDGRRLPGYAPFAGGAATNVAGLPLAAIDRVEILREGASAIYGSDAIGGVINLVTRRGEGGRLALQSDHPAQSGGASRGASVVQGWQGGRGHALVALDWQRRDALLGSQRDFLREHTALSTMGDPGAFRRRDPVTGQFIDFFQPDPRCPATLGDDPLFPHSVRTQRGSSLFCGYRFRDLNMERAALRTGSVLASGEFDLDAARSLYARVMAVDADVRTQLAPTPVSNLEIGASNPVNPTLGERGPGLGYPIVLVYRTSALGPRVTEADERSTHVLAGARGRVAWFEGGDWDLHLVDNAQRSHSRGIEGYALRAAFAGAIAGGRFDPFTATPDDARGLEQARWQPWQRGEVRSLGAGASLRFDASPWAGIAASHAIGIDLRRDRFDTVADEQTQAGQVLGQGAVPPRQQPADRRYGALYAESLWQPSQQFDVDLALRIDHYEDAGRAASPKLALAWRPSDCWLLRASAGRGFQAPDLVSAYGGFTTGTAFAVDARACAARPGDPFACEMGPVDVALVPNAALGPERATQASAGIAFLPSPAWHVSLDAIQTRVRDEIGRIDAADALAAELRCLQDGVACDPLRDGQVLRDASGNLEGVVLPRINIAGTRLRALDGEAGWHHAGAGGDWRATLRASRVLRFERQLQASLPRETFEGSRGRPRWRATVQLDWQGARLGASAGAQFIAAQRNCLFRSSSDPAATPLCDGRIPSHLQLDAQLRWRLPWDAEAALGLRNLADREPAFDPDGGFAYGLYDPMGRTAYLRYEQRF